MVDYCPCCRGSRKRYCARCFITAINSEYGVVGASVGVERDFTLSHAAGKDAGHCSCLGTSAYAEASRNHFGSRCCISCDNTLRNASHNGGCCNHSNAKRKLCVNITAP